GDSVIGTYLGNVLAEKLSARIRVRGEYHCKDGSFITATNYCDGARDCADGSDETGDACSTTTCSEYLFRCAYGACVDRGAICN
ncbi:Pattern recognition serine proteinase, partial [Operophtera brumata]